MKKNKIIIITLFLLSLFFLTSCWDERLLKNVRTVYLTGFDLEKEDNFSLTAVVRNLNISQSSRGEMSVVTEMITGEGRDLREMSLNLDQGVAGSFDPAKGKTIILGNDVATSNIYQIFDSIYREPRINLNTKIVVTSGTARELIQRLVDKEVEKSEYFYNLIKSREIVTEIPSETAQSLLTYLLDEGKDFFLPYLGVDADEEIIKVLGSALFHDHSFTGQYLTIEDSTLLLLLKGQKGKQAILTNQLDEGREGAISYKIKKVSRDMEVKKESKVHVDFTIKMDIEVIDYPTMAIDTKEKVDLLNKKISNHLTNEANRLFGILTENNSDILGIGRELIAYHPEIWEEIKGDDYYQEINVHPEVEVTIIGQGITL